MELGRRALAELAAQLGAEVGAVYLAGEDADGLARLVGALGADPRCLEPDLELTEPLVTRLGPDHVALVAPIRYRDRALGAFAFALPSNRVCSPSEIGAIERIADQTAVALANAHSFRRPHAARVAR